MFSFSSSTNNDIERGVSMRLLIIVTINVMRATLQQATWAKENAGVNNMKAEKKKEQRTKKKERKIDR